ncbi:MAG: xanthine dehydrogenase family protein subunit M [Acidobacteriota bacterium]
MTHDLKVYSPRALDEAYRVLSERGASVKVIAGGTDLMVLMNARQLDSQEFLDIWRVDELRGIADEGETLRIGALATYTELIRSPIIQKYAPALVAASRTVGAVQIQNRGTLGGNIVNASPAGDSLPVLAAYAAEIEIGSARGLRLIDFDHFYTAYRRTVLEPDELVVAVRVPKLKSDERDFFCKVGTRRAQAISKMVMAVKAKTENAVIEWIRIGVGSVAPTIVRARETESLLTGRAITADIVEQARQSISLEVSPITDLRSTEHYRRRVTGNVLARFLRQIIDSDGAGT